MEATYMPFTSRKPPLMLSEQEREHLQQVSKSRTEKHARVERARMLLAYAEGQSVSQIARQ